MLTKYKACLVLFACLLIVIFEGCTNKEAQIPIGIVLPLTGDYANLGTSAKHGIELAFRDAQGQPQKDQSKYSLHFEDSQGSTNGAVLSLRKLLDVNRCRFFIGELSSSATLAMVPIIKENDALLISPTASSPKLSGISKHFFRVCASDVFEGTYMARYAYNSIGLRKVGVLYINNDYGVGLANAFSEEFQSIGGTVSLSESYEEKTSDFRSLLAKVRSSGVVGVYIPGYAYELANILRQSKEMGLHFQFMSSIDFENPQIPKIAGDAAEGVIYTAYPFNVESKREATERFVEQYQATYSTNPDIYAALSYDAASVLIHCLSSHPPLVDSVRTCLLNLKAFPGATGEIEFESDGNVTHSIIFKTYSQGEFVPLVSSK